MKENTNHHFEVAAGYFFSFLLIICIGIAVFLAFQGELFFLKHRYVAYYEFGSGLSKGTTVTLNGIVIGDVVEVSIDERNRIEVVMSISRKHSSKIRRDSTAKVVRPMLIGAKQIFITPGSQHSAILPPGSVIRSSDSSELVDLISGISIDKFVKDLDLKKSFFDFSDDNMITARELYEQALSAMLIMNEFQKSIKDMSYNMSSLTKTMTNMSSDLQSMNELSSSITAMSESLGQLSDLSKSMYDIGKSISGVNKGFDGVTNAMVDITSEVRDIRPSIEKIDFLIDDLAILLLAMQKSWMFRNEVDSVKRELERERLNSQNN